MKKIIKKTDGTEETIEGTPEEIALYERQLRELGQLDEQKPGKPGVLHGSHATVDGIMLTEGEIELIRACRAISSAPTFPTYPTVDPYDWPPNDVYYKGWVGVSDSTVGVPQLCRESES